MRAIVTGASGFVGPYLVEHLGSQGDEVHGVDSTSGPDLLDPQGWHALFESVRPDVVYHLAGWADVGGSWDNPHAAFRVNAEGTMNVLLGARPIQGVRVILVSSADIYGTVTPTELPLTEDSPVKPRSPYGASKEAAEAIARQFNRGFGVDTVIARPFNHIGPGQTPKFAAAAFALKVAQCERDGGGTVTHGDLSPRRDFLDVRDVVRAYRLLAQHGTSGTTYNICSGKDTQVTDVLQMLIDEANVPIRTLTDPDLIRPIELAVHRGSYDRLAAATGWKPEINLRTTLADVLAHARATVINEVTDTKQENQ
ncbi:MAG: NAD-dependent epimerase/dehydratase family protein [Acidimicrobiales bacterium]|nr:NAD-dependent epimerase/dehydratase family protein [Acidimicrobiales bacterium]